MSNKTYRNPTVDQSIQQIAQREGKSPAEVRAAMQEAISAAFHSSDPATRARWAGCPRSGNVPTPEEFILWISGKISS